MGPSHQDQSHTWIWVKHVNTETHLFSLELVGQTEFLSWTIFHQWSRCEKWRTEIDRKQGHQFPQQARFYAEENILRLISSCDQKDFVLVSENISGLWIKSEQIDRSSEWIVWPEQQRDSRDRGRQKTANVKLFNYNNRGFFWLNRIHFKKCTH